MESEILISKNKEIDTKDFPVEKKDSFNHETFHGFLPVSDMFLPFHSDNLLALPAGNPVISCLQSLAQWQTAVRQTMTCYQEIQKMKKIKRQGKRETIYLPIGSHNTIWTLRLHCCFQFYFTLLEIEKSRAVQCWLLTQLCSCPLFLSY